MASRVLSTYRLQMRGDCFTFDDAISVLDYLDELGVSHLYLSPILSAAEGSTHGYDVTDPTTVSPALGGPDGLARLSAAAKARGMGLVVDIVPNHVGVDDPTQNHWWLDVLEKGRSSPYSSYFDIDWDLDPDGRVIVPVLGSDDDPAPPNYPAKQQHYRPIGWRNGICGYRRFFSITSLAGLRQEDRAVFDATHVEVKRWFTDGLVDGIRIDHPDGLSNPAGYLEWLRELVGPDAWIVIEKILAVDEPLDTTLPVAGTTGYDALREIGGVFLDPAGAGPLTALFDSTGADYDDMSESARRLKAAAVTDTLASELARLHRTIRSATGADHPEIPTALAELISRVPVYRCDYGGLSLVLSEAVAETSTARPELAEPLTIVASALATNAESAVRLQQLCGAATAKSMEDCLFYRDARLVSLNEVGGEPGRFGVSIAEFHERAATRARLWPHAMVALTTHDTKRGEDVRARIGVLSQVPSLWAELVGKWVLETPPPDAATALFLLQNMFGVWPVDGAVTEDLRGRLHGYAEKAIREAAAHTSWNDPDTAFENAVHEWLDAVMDGQVGAGLTSLARRLDQHAHNDSLGQKLIALTAPGIPDVYQGTELWEDSLVDPDNRRPVDYLARRQASRHPKFEVTRAALQLRRDRPDTFLNGGYTPLLPQGAAAGHLVAFLRADDVVTAVTRHSVGLAETGWKDTTLVLPTGAWPDRIAGGRYSRRVLASDLFAEAPVALLERTDD
ncbi:malto-oligosyltrehalose synthase [Mycobacterium sp. NPDC048908]|uniref:malto-oligosyltrehalose synthase n=1 Tax=Mycobacterium sp. NPDC048908 TaxID=3364292 RepID=UPI00371FC098